ncbi:MAG: VWA-like domain-containing protein [Lachnospiraceae bacterium]|nr:VWA-like domain-containing protein [Lachnospiraceae bacterium]
MNVEEKFSKFKVNMLRNNPFYGDIIMKVKFVERGDIGTAATDGKYIYYNNDYMNSLSEGQFNFVVLHEVLHLLLGHCKRHGERDTSLWNTACDIVVNNMILKLIPQLQDYNMPMEKPPKGVFRPNEQEKSADDFYYQFFNRYMVVDNEVIFDEEYQGVKSIEVPDDVIESDFSEEEETEIEVWRKQVIKESLKRNKDRNDSVYIPREMLRLVESKTIAWDKLLIEYLSEVDSDETSYSTPERKYLYREIIAPGYGHEEKLERVWLFIDSSGSINEQTMNEFYTQAYRICRNNKCELNIAYWDTKVTTVYRNIRNYKEMYKLTPKHIGGTDINCVYDWIKENRIKPVAMIVLTDGYFGILEKNKVPHNLRKKTIVLLTDNLTNRQKAEQLGKITYLRS